MQQKKLGKGTFRFENPPSIVGYSAVVGKKEGQGPLKNYFDTINTDTTFGENTWEKAESHMQKQSLSQALQKARLSPGDMDLLFAGDLLNQCISSTYGLRDYGIPMVGLFGACSTMAESLCAAAMAVDGGFATHAACVTSSHFCTAERQFRTPLEYGGQRPPTSQWTVTGSGCVLLSSTAAPPYITHCTVGEIVDMGVTDANNMGAAMAPAAFTTLQQFFLSTGTSPKDYDLILSGDLGTIGRSILKECFAKEGYDLSKNYDDCGCMIFDIKAQDVNSGGSGCGCAASVLTSYVLPRMAKGELNQVLFMATGALMSPTALQQGESIPGIAHLVRLSNQ